MVACWSQRSRTPATQVSRADSDAFAYLRSIPAISQTNQPHALAFPYSSQTALAVWRALFFRAAEFVPEPAQAHRGTRRLRARPGPLRRLPCRAQSAGR